jgi:hypothetical protein
MLNALVQLAAALALLVVLWKLFRMAMGLRAERLFREEARRTEEAAGGRIVAEMPGSDGGLVLFVEDPHRFRWGTEAVAKTEIVGARLLLNGGVMAQAVRAGTRLPDPAAGEEYEGRERWDVRLHTGSGTIRDVPCGTVREGVSRGAAREVFEAVRAELGRREEGAA